MIPRRKHTRRHPCCYSWQPKRHAPATWRIRWTAHWHGSSISDTWLMCEAHAARAVATQTIAGSPAQVRGYRFRRFR